MKSHLRRFSGIFILWAGFALLAPAAASQAMIHGVSGTSFELTARVDHIQTPDGGSPMIWGYALDTARAQYPGPTFIINQGETVTITLRNELPLAYDTNVSIVFPGQDVTASGGIAGLMTQEAARSDNPATIEVDESLVTYTFTANRAGTYLYHSGTRQELQVEMGLFGAIVVRPSLGPGYSYNHSDSRFDYEYLFLLSEMDPRIHQMVEFYGPHALEETDFLSDYFPNYWFINGRAAPDTMAAPGTALLPTQPYNCMPRMHPGDKLLMRMISAGRDLHPFHFHGNHARIIARDGRLLESTFGAGPDLSYMAFTTQMVPGETIDQIFEWTGEGLGWDMYGHSASDPMQPGEYAPDHGKPFPVVLPESQELAFGGFWSGSPFLGSLGTLPPGEGGLNPNAGFAYMWHSHTEKEMTNYDIFPGGMMTMLIIEPPGVPIP